MYLPSSISMSSGGVKTGLTQAGLVMFQLVDVELELELDEHPLPLPLQYQVRQDRDLSMVEVGSFKQLLKY